MSGRKFARCLLTVYILLRAWSKEILDSRNNSVILNLLRGNHKIKVPTVDILGIDSRWNFDCKGCEGHAGHEHDLLFFKYLMKHSVLRTRLVKIFC